MDFRAYNVAFKPLSKPFPYENMFTNDTPQAFEQADVLFYNIKHRIQLFLNVLIAIKS